MSQHHTELEEIGRNKTKHSSFDIQPTGCKINIEFSNLSYEVADREGGVKYVLKNIHGEFRSNQLTVIMGTSGSGKTTLINLLAGYRIHKTSGIINVNRTMQNIKIFRKISRYILQHDYVSPHFTVMESMRFAANLKLNGHSNEQQQHADEIRKILQTLHLANQCNTKVKNLSGGEKKRLCIAMELINIPPVLFLDEPTTGLDEFSAMQCISMLRHLASTGRTIICSVHAPSARMFQMFDHVYVLANGECIYQGGTSNIIPYLAQMGLDCPLTYNPADFIIEVAAGEYGDYHETMVNEVKNGKVVKWLPANISAEQNGCECLNSKVIDHFEMEVNSFPWSETTTSWWREYKILCEQMLRQMWRDKTYIKLKAFIKLFTVFCISVVYTGIGTNAAMLIYNYHFTFLTSITFIFLSMCPMLSHIPLEMNYLRREHFNQWYRLSSYFMALVTTQIPEIFLLGVISSAMLYFSTEQPVELTRFLLFLLIALLTSLTASSYGLAVSSRLNLLNSLFLGPCFISCWVIFANHSVGNPNLSLLEKILMYSGFVRHSVEGLMSTLFQFNRSDPICPDDVIFCLFKKPKYLLKLVGYENLNYVNSSLYLFGFYVFFNLVAYVNFSCRLGSIIFLERSRYYQNVKKNIFKYFNAKF